MLCSPTVPQVLLAGKVLCAGPSSWLDQFLLRGVKPLGLRKWAHKFEQTHNLRWSSSTAPNKIRWLGYGICAMCNNTVVCVGRFELHVACASKDVSKGEPLLFHSDESLTSTYMNFF